MTAREIYEGTLFELNKAHAPALSVEEFVYFLNKAILSFVNERYNFYAVNQQLTDDLRVLVKPHEAPLTSSNIHTDTTDSRYVSIEITEDDYFHLLSCDLVVRNTISNKLKKYTVKRLTLDMYGAINNNEYLKPAIHRPYHFLLPVDGTNEQDNTTINVYIGDAIATVVPSALRIFYLRLPVAVTLTDAQVYNMNSDTSQVLEFPGYLKNEFVKRVTWYQLEETRDQRAATFPQLNQEILSIPMEQMGGQQPTTQSQQ